PETKELFARVKRAEAQVQSDQDIIEQVKQQPTKEPGAAEQIQQQLDLMQAQLELDKDELEDAKWELFRSGADPLSRIQRQFARYQAAQAAQQAGDAARPQADAQDAGAGSEGGNLIQQVSAWRVQRASLVKLQQARDEALRDHEELQQKHAAQQQTAPAESNSGKAGEPGGASDQAVIASLRRLSEHQKNLADLNKRIQDQQDLGDVYGSWIGLAQVRQLATLHSILKSGVLIVLVILAVYLVDRAVDHFFANLIPERRRMWTLRVIVRFAVQAAGVLLILFVLFGMPNQMPTILGLAGAGLTVALKDFIVAFFGWFSLMGRNGIRVGDWVEINGVGGEVAEISLLRTTLLETGNWTDSGHPTGRKVSFVNSFAIEGHYFNFSTSGQWLWDEIQILVPSTKNPYPIIDGIQKLVSAETEPSARMAEEEWRRVTDRKHVQSVSAAPAINLRPTTSGVEVHVRYITRAHERYAMRARLYQEIVSLLHQKQESAPSGSVAGAV
ncbi:MAG TPA: mechanosensitive ion channel domain-containing protein, partial [Terriglobales bacterium]|nr:mechanosensitive ion channel domain-containing protein [Terriglobales bacterium]